MRPLAVVGNVNVDIIVGDCPPVLTPGTESMVDQGDVRPAGAAGNSALAWQALRVPFQLAANTGDDMFGDWLRAIFREHGARWPRESCATSFSVGISHPDSERTFLTTPGHIARLSLEQVRSMLDMPALRNGIALIVGGFLTDRLTAAYPALFDLLSSSGVEIAIDTGWPIQGWTPGIRVDCRGWLARCNHVLMNEVELLSLFEVREIERALAAAARLAPKGAAIVVKCGPRGAVGLRDGTFVEVPAPAVAAIDTVGAGDVFNAGYLAGIAAGLSFEAAITQGTQIASLAISTHPRRYVDSADRPRDDGGMRAR
jgi:sugar/nucleoside kinase (ribokinase family)